MIVRGLHHNAYRCRDSEKTRSFYEDFLGLPLSGALDIGETMTGRSAKVLHTFYAMGDGSYMAFFEVPEVDFEFKEQHDFDLHIALETSADDLQRMLEKAQAEGREVRGPTDHGMVHSIYLRDPSGYVVELTAKTPRHDELMNPETNGARRIVDDWQRSKASSS